MSAQYSWQPLPKEEVIKAIERRYPARVPLVQTQWWGEGFQEMHGAALDPFNQYPEDAIIKLIEPVEPAKMELSWPLIMDGARDSRVVIDDWAKLDEFIEKLPDPDNDPQMDGLQEIAEQARQLDRYFMFGWWRLFFERPWAIRGMQNLLLDFYLHPEEVHRLHAALADHYIKYLAWGVRELQPDGFWTSDDLGHQKQLFMRPETFRSLIKPYYMQMGKFIHGNDMHWWLHSCGNNTAILDDLIEAGVDVFHPVQKGTMDYERVAAEYGDRLTFLVGFDVQHVLQEESPEDVRAEVREIIDTFDRKDGGMCIAAGNGILPGTPLENVDAFIDESLRYGAAHRQRFLMR